MDQQTLVNNGFHAAPSWAIAVGQLGAALVLAGVALFLTSIVSMILGQRAQTLGKWAFAAGCVCILGAMASLVSLFLNDQYQFEYVANHSWHDLAGMYKVAAVWSGQQGSFLLWATTSALFGLLAVWRTGPYQRWFVFVYALFLGCLCGILAYETPFSLLNEISAGDLHLSLVVNGIHFAPPNGLGLTPSLQNYWVVVHPPTIFTGFGSLTVPFAFAVSALLTGDAAGWIARVRPWALVSLSILGLGLVMGGLWAYETQGWGGFWAWDPVENVSFVPWLFVVAFVHGIIVQTTRKRWHGTNMLLGGLPFLLFVYGTFLTRSGFLSKFSVHSFAEMNRSALWILMVFLGIMVVGFVALWAMRGPKLGRQNDAAFKRDGLNREVGYQFGVLLITGLSAAIAFGMSVPFFVGLFGGTGK
ncbi:MAG TPA: cytochrome c biogenesis protein CcsA, partial [Fimbriimonadaceae bacterium]|nr:cytochrome c biogenesis protein CcsA [Fimbriimonadaceae bacterium]